MKRIEFLELISNLFAFKTISDRENNTYVVYADSTVTGIDRVPDRTQFEAVENHVHLMDRVKKEEYHACVACGEKLGRALISSLNRAYPDRHFFVFVTVELQDSMIIRFHQKWEGEEPYYDPDALQSDRVTVLKYETGK